MKKLFYLLLGLALLNTHPLLAEPPSDDPARQVASDKVPNGATQSIDEEC